MVSEALKHYEMKRGSACATCSAGKTTMADGSVTKDKSVWGVTVKQGETTVHEDSAACTVSASSLTMEVKAAKGFQTTHAIIITGSNSLLHKVKSGRGILDWDMPVSTSVFKISRGCTVLDMPEI